MDEFKKNVVSGISWSFVNQFATQVLNLAITLVLVRFVSPGEFGTLGMVTVLTGFANAFVNFGFAATLVQKENTTEKDIATVFTVGLISSLILYLVFFMGAGAIAGFYDKPELQPIVRIVALNFLLLSTGIVQNSILVRALKFKRIALINMAAIGLAGITGIVMAVLGYGIWSIVVQGLLLSSLTSLLYWFTSGVKIRLGFDRTAFSSMFNFGGHAAADSVLSYWARNLDNLLIAKFLGDISLGLYSKAYSIMLLPLVNFSQVISRVLFPSFSSIQNDREKIRRVYLRITRIIAFVTFPLMIALWALAENIVLVFLGQDWTGMIPLLEILCWLGIPQSILTLNGSIYHSLGRADLAFRVGLILKLNLVIGFVAGLYFGGLLGLALGYAIAGTVNFYPSFYFAGRLIDLKLGEQLKNLQGIVGCALAMGIFVFAAKQGRLLEGWGLLQELLVLTAGGAVLYLLLLFLFKIPVLDELKVELRSVLTKEP